MTVYNKIVRICDLIRIWVLWFATVGSSAFAMSTAWQAFKHFSEFNSETIILFIAISFFFWGLWHLLDDAWSKAREAYILKYKTEKLKE